MDEKEMVQIIVEQAKKILKLEKEYPGRVL